jgi:aminoglycoside phosphotransferase (APT) family kinase protein
MSDIDTTALAAWLQALRPDLSGPVSTTKFPGGQSNPTYKLNVGRDQLVLRRQPSGKLLPSAHAVDREYRLMTALHPTGFPVPKPIALCMEASPIQTSFMVMQFVDGRIFWDGALPSQSPTERRQLYNAMVDTLARLHNIRPSAVGLEDYGRPGNYVERQVRRWTKQYRASQTDELHNVEMLIDYLAAGTPSQTDSRIIHGDYRMDNLVFDPGGPHVAAVLDWELSTLGDPVADFAYLAMHWVMPLDGRCGLHGLNLEAAGIPTLEEIVARYSAATGRASLPDLRWYFAYNLFRLVAILQGVKRRMVDGNASNAAAEVSVRRIAPLAALAWEQAQLAGKM